MAPRAGAAWTLAAAWRRGAGPFSRWGAQVSTPHPRWRCQGRPPSYRSGGAGRYLWMTSCWRTSLGHTERTPRLTLQFLVWLRRSPGGTCAGVRTAGTLPASSACSTSPTCSCRCGSAPACRPESPLGRRRSGSRSSSTREPSSRAGCTCCSRSGHTRCSRSWCRRALRGSLGKQGPQGPRSVPPSSLLTPGRGLLGRAPAPHQALTSCRPQLSLHLQSPEAHKRPFSSALPRCLGFHHWNRLLLVNHT